jgi:hypothetical protein
MIIISPFKDYYDFLVGKYGRDEKVVYNRGNAKETQFSNSKFYNTKPKILHEVLNTTCDGFNNQHLAENYNCNILAICGKLYFLKIKVKDTIYPINNWSKYSVITTEDLEDDHLYRKIIGCLYSSYYYFRKNNNYKKEVESKLYGVYDKNLLKISCQIKNPVFLIIDKNYYDTIILEKTPILKDIKGISGLLSPDVIYQEISYFIGNVLNQPKEEVKISDKSKILKAGFDLKTSFRNM